MGRIIDFIIRRWLVALLIVLSAMAGALGYAQQGAQIWEYGPPGWAFQLFAFLLFLGVVTVLIFQWDEQINDADLQERPSAAAVDAVAQAKILRDARRQIQSAAYSVDWEGYDHGPQQAAKDYAVLQSAFATARKMFGLNTPELAGPSAQSLAVGVSFLNQVWPFIESGHLDEAKEHGDAFIAQL